MEVRDSRRRVVSAFGLAGVLTATPVAAQVDTLRLTIEEAVRLAVENNPELAIVRLGTEVEAARVGESWGAFVPVFSTQLGRSSRVTPPANFLLGDRGVAVDDWFSSTGVRQRLPWGSGTWSVSWDPISSFDPSLESGFELAFSQPFLRDRAIDEARQQCTIAKRNRQSSDLRFREAVDLLEAEVDVLEMTLEYESALVNFEAVQQAPPLAAGDTVTVRGGNVVLLPTPTPRGIFRPGADTEF
jgi:hypothetical protein